MPSRTTLTRRSSASSSGATRGRCRPSRIRGTNMRYTTIGRVWLATTLAAVGESTCPRKPGDLPEAAILVAGIYSGHREWIENHCGERTVLEPLTLVIAQEPGAVSATLNDGHATFNGSLGPDGSYAIVPISATLNTGIHFEMALAGVFTRTGVTLRQTVIEHRAAGDCRYVIEWVADKQEAPNAESPSGAGRPR